MTCDPHWTAYLAALLTPTVAVLGSLIAYRQWRTAQNKLKLDLFDRRFAVYSAATTLLASIMGSGMATDEKLFEFLSATRDAKWLLSTEISAYLEKELYHKAVDLQCLATELQDMPRGEERSANVHKQSEIKKWFLKQYEVLDEKFSLYLKLKH
jgi:hypothetical protein